jgi:hypothetical protein
MLDELERAKLHPDVLRNLAKNKQLKKTEAYSEDNPPPYPVTSVNGQTGAVAVLQYVDARDINVSIQTNGGYQSLGTFASFGVPTGAYIVSFFVRGWTGANGTISLLAGSDGSTLYAMMSDCPSSVTINVRIFYTFL